MSSIVSKICGVKVEDHGVGGPLKKTQGKIGEIHFFTKKRVEKALKK